MKNAHAPAKSADAAKTIVKSITVRELFRCHPETKKMLWGGNL